MNPIVLAVAVLTVLGLVGSIILVLASKFMAVYEDPRIAEVTACLAGASCCSRATTTTGGTPPPR